MSARPVGKRASFQLIHPSDNDGAAPYRIFLVLLNWLCRPGNRVNFDSFSDHMLRDIGVDPKSREDASAGFWRRR